MKRKELQIGLRVIPKRTLVNSICDPQRLLRIIWDLADDVGFVVSGVPDIKFYPMRKETEESWIQIYQPFTESWIVLKSFPDDGIIKINVGSRKSNIKKVREWIEKNIGYVSKQVHGII